MLFSSVIHTLDLRKIPTARQTVAVARMIQILDAERSRYKRVKDWNEKLQREIEANKR